MKEFDWLQPTLERLSDLLKMPDYHNSHGTPKAGPSSTIMALRVMIKFPYLPVPVIVPAVDEGFEFSWQGTSTECFLCVSSVTSGVSARENGQLRDFGMFRSSEDCLEEMLGKISGELTPVIPVEPAP